MVETFHLKWEDFPSKITSKLSTFQDSGVFCDVTLACKDDREIKAHKVVLSASSPFFERVLKRSDHSHPWIYMAGLNSNELESILQFIYQGETQVAEHDIVRFLKKANQMEIQGLTVWNNGAGIGSKLKKKHVHDLNSEPIMTPECLIDETKEEININSFVDIKYEATDKTDKLNGENIEVELEGFPQEAEVGYHGNCEDLVVDLEGHHLQEENTDNGIVENNENKKVRHSFGKLLVDNDIVKEDGVYLCRICGKTKRKLFQIRKHYEIHHQRQWTSDNGISENTENRKVRNRHSLGDLLGDDDIVKEDGVFLCRLCGKSKGRLFSIRKHIEIHRQGQTFP